MNAYHFRELSVALTQKDKVLEALAHALNIQEQEILNMKVERFSLDSRKEASLIGVLTSALKRQGICRKRIGWCGREKKKIVWIPIRSRSLCLCRAKSPWWEQGLQGYGQRCGYFAEVFPWTCMSKENP